MTRPSKYKLGWIILRVRQHGKSHRILKRAGWMRLHHAEINNRTAADWLLPASTFEKFQAMDFSMLSTAGLEGIAFWITDAQWCKNRGCTDAQWQARKIIVPNN